MNDIEAKLYAFILEHFEIEADDPDFTPEIDMFEYGYLDSLGSFEIIEFIEATWNVEITQKDLIQFPMNSIREIAAVVSRKFS